MSEIVFCAPSEYRAQMECDFLAEPAQWGPDITWQLGEPRYWYRVEPRVGRGWCVFREVRA